jgi:hypothetical protein
MPTITRRFKWLVSLALACIIGSLPSCGTMGGGGMKYLMDPPSAAWEATWL